MKLSRLRHRPVRHADLARHLVGLGVGQAGLGVDGDLVYFFRMVRGDLFNFHAALGTRHQGHALRRAVDDHADIEFLADVCALLDQQALDDAAFRTRFDG